MKLVGADLASVNCPMSRVNSEAQALQSLVLPQGISLVERDC